MAYVRNRLLEQLALKVVNVTLKAAEGIKRKR
jgi:hypothetical protein